MAKPNLFFIHGMWSFAAVWETIRAELEAQGFATHAATLPGHDAVPGDLSTLGLADYVAALEAQAVALPEPPVIIGHSMGGLLAQLLATRLPHRGLVLLSTAPSAGILALHGSAIKTTWPVMKKWGYWHKPSAMTREAALYGIFNGVPDDEAEAAIAQLRPDSGRVMFQIGLPFLDKTKASVVDYKKLTAPTLIVCGTADRITPIAISRATARRVSGPVQYKEMDGFGHWLLGEQARPRVVKEISSFAEALSVHV